MDMGKMRMFFVAALSVMVLEMPSACAQNAGKSDKSEKARVTVISEASYAAEIENYAEEGWKYLGEMPAVVDFYADWCGPCRKLAPVMESMAAEYAGKVRFYKVNVDNARALSSAYGIRSIPSVLFIPVDGEPVMNVGLMDEKTFREKIEDLLSGK